MNPNGFSGICGIRGIPERLQSSEAMGDGYCNNGGETFWKGFKSPAEYA
jgi:hypothetical protein